LSGDFCVKLTAHTKLAAAFSQSAVALHRVAALCFAPRSPLLELAGVLVRLDHIARVTVNTRPLVSCIALG
jgi:hypothetical protein